MEAFKEFDEVNSASETLKTADEIRLEAVLFNDANKQFNSDKEHKLNVQECGTKRRAVWTDDEEFGADHEEQKHDLRRKIPFQKRKQIMFDKVRTAPKWAEFKNEENDELLTIGNIKNSATFALPADDLQIKKLKSINRDAEGNESITSVQFHPSSTVALVAGNSGVSTLHAVDGCKNEKIHSIRFKNYPITCARFFDGGNKVLFGGIKNHLFSYDLLETSEKCHFFPKHITNFMKFDISPCEKYVCVAGRFGEIHLLDLKSKEVIHTYKQDEPVTAIKFSKDSRIFTHSSESKINVLNLKTLRIEHTFIDDGCVHGRCVDISQSGGLLASGSQEGVVNLYNYEDVFANKYPKPIKTLFNLKTAISDVKFNGTSEILGFCSDLVPGAVKLYHCGAGTVFSNFPGFQNKLHKIKLVEFSPLSGYLGLGSSSNEVSLHRLKHFKNY